MFDSLYTFKGKHADMVIALTGKFSLAAENGDDIKKHALFDRNYDVYLLAPIIGFLYRRKANIDTSESNSTTKVFAEIIMRNIDDLRFNYQIIMLLDKENEPNSEARIEKAFRGTENKDDELLYNSYVLGGVEVLYEKLIKSANTADDYINNLYDFLDEFYSRYNEDLDIEGILELARKNTL